MFDTVNECPPRSVLPAGLAEMAPGPELAVVLAGLDRMMLNGHEMVIVFASECPAGIPLPSPDVRRHDGSGPLPSR